MKRVLVLHSYHKGFSWTDNLQSGVESVLFSSDFDKLEVMVEYLDTKRVAPGELFPLLQALLARKYQYIRPDVIICSDDNALDYLLANRETYFPGTPVVFCGINDFTPQRVEGHTGYTGVAEIYDLRGTVGVALRLHPKAQTLAVISDSTETGAINLKRFHDVAQEFTSRVTIRELTNLTTEELVEALKKLSLDTVILNLSFFRDRNGKTYSPKEMGRVVGQNTALPVYAPWDFFLEGDVVGGKVVSGFQQGAEAASMAVRILKGTPVRDIAPLMESPNRYMFDYGPLLRAGVRPEDLPEDSVVLNQPESFYLRYKWQIWTAVVVFTCMAILLVVMGASILQRRKAQRALGQALGELQSFFDNSLMGILVLRGGRRIFRANQRCAEILGFSDPEELVGESTRAIHLSQEHYDEFGQRYADALDAGGKLHIEYQLRRKNGDPIWVILSGRTLDDHTPPDPAKGMLWVIDDLTNRKMAEEELRGLKNLLRNILDSMPSVLIGVDTAGRVIQWNHQAQQETGLTAEMALGRTLESVYPHMPAPWEEIRQGVLERKAQRFDKLNWLEDGQKRVSDITVYPLVANCIEGAVIRVDDITAKVRMEEVMVQTEKMMSLGGLAAGMAHEINNPLAGILQSAQTILRRASEDIPANREAAEDCGCGLEQVQCYLEKRKILSFMQEIHDSGKRAAQIVRNMLEFSRGGAAASSADVTVLMDEAVELAANDYDLKKKYDFRRIAIHREYQAGLPLALCSSQDVEQVVLNLLKNAAQAMNIGANADSATITLRALKENGWVRIEVEDNGPGMAEEVRKHVFEPFFTTKPAGEGTGLGLSVSYFIITRKHGGSIEVESEPGSGAKFVIRLPISNLKEDISG